MWSIQTASRLHLGLLSLPEDGPSRSLERRFGGVGLMIDAPGLVIRCEEASAWSAEGPLAPRILASAEQMCRALTLQDPSLRLPPRRLIVEQAPREHVGLGTGTQSALAVASVLTRSWGRLDPVSDLARLVGRGQRSALGVHGFRQGGFLVEAGKRIGQALSPLVARLEVPAEWRVLIVVPPGAAGLHGLAEQAAFTNLVEPSGYSEALCRLVLLGILPALAEADLPAFGEAVFEFNRRAGNLFAGIQGGTYAGRAVAETVASLRDMGIAGVGQSSWGPGVFAFVADKEEAAHLASQVRAWPGFAEALIEVTPACNHGAVVVA